MCYPGKTVELKTDNAISLAKLIHKINVGACMSACACLCICVWVWVRMKKVDGERTSGETMGRYKLPCAQRSCQTAICPT